MYMYTFASHVGYQLNLSPLEKIVLHKYIVYVIRSIDEIHLEMKKRHVRKKSR